jgi:tetratricopeptide (TPR) repeat protein
MAKKKRKPGGDRSRRRRQPDALRELPDRRLMERTMRQLVGGLTGRGRPNTPLDKAQEIMYRAFEEQDVSRRVQLARQALEVCPDCADAYVLLAEHAGNGHEALPLWEQAVAAGERALGSRAFQEEVGHFWGILETRPFMRAKEGLASALWTAGRRAEAIQHLHDMLRLNPNDNQGVRYTLAGFLLSEDRDDDLTKLLHQFPEEGSATWAYTETLLAFRQQSDAADKLLRTAIKANRHVPAFLLGRERLPEERPPYYSPGKESEAIMYAGIFLRNWKATPGAITWLRQATRKKEPQPQPKGPLGFIKKWLIKHLPQAPDIWQADFRQVPEWITVGGEKLRTWTILVTSRTEDLVLAHRIVEDSPLANHVWDTLVQAMQHPVVGEPHRPIQLQVRTDERWASLKPHIEEVGIELVENATLDQMNVVFDDLHTHLAGKPRTGLLEMPGMTAEQVAGFFDAAAGFYRRVPWKRVGDDATLKVECAKFESGPWYGVIMGQAGMTLGLALYENLRVVRNTQKGTLCDESHARQAVGLSVTFGEQTEMAVKDLEAIQRHGWKVGGPEAYPCIFKKERGMSIRPPLAWELELMEGCLRAVPEFVDRRQQKDPSQEEITVPVASGHLKLVLSWVVDEVSG